MNQSPDRAATPRRIAMALAAALALGSLFDAADPHRLGARAEAPMALYLPMSLRGPMPAAERVTATGTRTRSMPPRWPLAPARLGCSTRSWYGST